MAEAWQQRVPVIGRWAPRQRRKASMASTIAAIALLGFAIVAMLSVPSGSQTGTFLLVILVLLLVTFVFQALVVVTGLKQAPAAQAEGNPAWQQAYSPPRAAAPATPPAMAPAEAQLTLKCSSCGTVFDVMDTGERPLRHTCPGCGVQGELSEADLGPAPAVGPTITLKCSSCGTVFDVTDTGARPLQHVCPGCGSEGVLREEDLPAPVSLAPAPAPVVASPPVQQASRSVAGGVRVKTLKLRCKNCSTVFTLRDNGDRPLYHECPGCKATGVLR
ncbi:MAG: zinc ribbon domain-containing protein [Halobacteriales archaeon]|nr:zinc ribbon domain-containing protein [Halobacteriales archaeon]